MMSRQETCCYCFKTLAQPITFLLRSDSQLNKQLNYLATLQAHGVTNYTWEQLMEDYRLMSLIFLQVAIWDQTNGSVRDYW